MKINKNRDKIEKLKNKIKDLELNNDKISHKKRPKGAGFGFKISTEIVAALIVGVGIGLLVDNYFNTRPFGLIIFFIFGAFAGFLNIYRVMRRIEENVSK